MLTELLLRVAELVDAFDDAFFGALGHRRHRVVFVLQRDVIVDGLVFFVHAVQAVFDHGGELVRKRDIVSDAVRNRHRDVVAVAVFVLQAFAVQGGAAGGGAEDEAARHLITSGPKLVTGTLEPEHRIEDVKRDQLAGRASRTTSRPR